MWNPTTSMMPNRPTNLENKQPSLENLLIGVGYFEHYDMIVFKVSYPIRRFAHEGRLLSEFVGRFSIIDVAGLHICEPSEPHGSIESFFQSANPWSVCDGSAAGEPEERR